jgi:AcrR family transcriptional regulator
MPRPRYEDIDPKKKERLLDAAMKEFGTHGYELASINRILEAASFSKGSFYYYFEDKLDLAVTVFLVVAGPELNPPPLELPTTTTDFWAELRRSSLRRLQVLESKPVEYACLIRLSNASLTDPALMARVLPSFAVGRAQIGRFLDRGVELGALRRDLPVGTMMSLVEAAKAAAYKQLFPGDRVPTDPEMESFTDLVIDLAQRICAPPLKG